MENLKTSYTKNILKKYHIRIFLLNNNYLLVDSDNFAFMMFKPLEQKDFSSNDVPTITVVDYYFRFPISDFKTLTRIYFDKISPANLKYICDTFSFNCILKPQCKDFNERIQRIMHVHGISSKFANFIARNPHKINLYEICQDLREANFYIKHKFDWLELLIQGKPKEKKIILSKILPTKTYQIMNIDSLEPSLINVIAFEIINIA